MTSPKTVADYIDDDGLRVRYVEVPQIEYRDVYVDKVEFVDVERRVPDVQVVEIEKLVELNEIHEITREVEVVQEQEIIKEVPRREVVQVPVEVVKEVPIYQKRTSERVVEVPGEIIEVEKPYTVENRVIYPRYKDRQVNTVVTQIAQPILRRVDQDYEVHAYDYDPVLCKVLIHVPKPISMPAFFGGKLQESHRYIELPDAEYNGLVRGVNRPLHDQYLEGLLVLGDSSGAPIPPINDTGYALVPPKGKVSGVPPPLPIQRMTRAAHSGTANFESLGTSSWVPRRGQGLDTDAERYYREHHQFFNPNHRRSPTAQTARSRPAMGSRSITQSPVPLASARRSRA